MTSQDPLPNVTTIKDRAKSKLERDAKEILFALQDPDTVEIMVNADGRIWQEKLGQKIQHIGNIQTAQVEAVIKTVAGFHGKEVNRFNPMIEGEFPLDNSRFAGQLPPIVLSPTFAIRKKTFDEPGSTRKVALESDEILWSSDIMSDLRSSTPS